MKTPRAALLGAVAVLCGACDQPSGSAATASSAKPSASASAPALPDIPAPAWLPPPDYVEIPWAKAVDLLRTGAADRYIATRTRRVYLSTPSGEKYFTAEPKHGYLKKLLGALDPETRQRFKPYSEWEEISWQEAEAKLRSKQCNRVGIAHFQVVTLGCRPREELLTIVPATVDVQKLLHEVDPSDKLLDVIE